MAVGTDLVQAMKYLDNDIDTTADKTQALWALNRAQDAIELVIAKVPHILGTTDTVATAASTETTAVPAGFLRYDRLHYLHPTTSLPVYPALEPIHTPGDVRTLGGEYGGWWGGDDLSPGRPRAYNLYGDSFWWAPLPDAVHTVRVYGFKAASDITDVGTFAYGDEYITVIAAVALRAFKQQVDDPQDDINLYAEDMMSAILANLRNRWRDGYERAGGRYIHTT